MSNDTIGDLLRQMQTDKQMLLDRKAALASELTDVDSQLLRVTSAEEYLAAHQPTSPRAAEASRPKKPLPRPVAKYDGLTRHEACEAILRDAGRPLRTAAIGDILAENGADADTDRKKLISALFTAMTRHDKTFVKLDSGEWDLVKQPAE